MHLHQDKVCPFSTGDHVQFKEVQGMTEINHAERPFQIKVIGKYAFSIDCDTTTLSPYSRNGIVEQVKVPSKLEFQSLEHCISRPLPPGESCLIVPDLAKFGRSEQLHLAIQALYKYRVGDDVFLWSSDTY